MASLLTIDAPAERVDEWRPELEAAGYRIAMVVPDEPVTAADADHDGDRDRGEAGPPASRPPVALPLPASPPDVIVLVAPSSECRAWDLLTALRGAGDELGDVPVVLVVGPSAFDDALRGAIEGAVRCHVEPLAADTLVASLDAVLAPDAAPVREQRRRARQRALELLARIEARGAASDDDVHPRLVHLTRLEHRPVRAAAPEPLADARLRLDALTTKQRALLELVRAEGGVTAVASRLETSRGNVYAGLRRIVHRLGMRDTRELLRVVGSGELLSSSQS